jgi:hypothetical protein
MGLLICVFPCYRVIKLKRFLHLFLALVPSQFDERDDEAYATMFLSTLVTASTLLTTITALPLADPITTLGSKHVVYLSTCAPTDCPIGLCDPEDFNIVAAGYFRNGPPTSNTASASSVGVISSLGSSASWEGTKRNVRIGSDGTYTSNIPKGAKSVAKGELTGDGELKGGSATEPFVCFRDGVTKFRVSYELDKYSCTADYYCPSIAAGTSDA